MSQEKNYSLEILNQVKIHPKIGGNYWAHIHQVRNKNLFMTSEGTADVKFFDG
jgi:hypothetical protein